MPAYAPRRQLMPRLISLAALLAGLVFGGPAAPAAASSTFTVTKTADTNDGMCDADCSLREAVGAANAAPDTDTIILPSGGYALALGSLTISNPLILNGALSSTTIITATTLEPVFEISTAISATLSNVTLQGGWSPYAGGLNNRGTLLLTDSTLSHNMGLIGAGLYNSGALTIQRSAIVHNTAGSISIGGGIYSGGALTITDSLIADNTAGRGGGIYNAGTLSLTNSSLSGNQTYNAYGGGGIYNQGTLTVTHSAFTANSVLDFGAGLVNTGSGQAWVDSSLFDYNLGGVGSGIWNEGGQLTLSNSAVVNNLGGGIYNTDGLTVTNATLSGNFFSILLTPDLYSDRYASGLLMDGGTADLNNVTLNGTVAYGLYQTGGTVNLRNSVVAGIYAPFACFGAVNSQDYNLVQDMTGCTISGTTTHVITNTDPLLGLLQDNGGGTYTLPLLQGSPALDAGNPASPGSGGLACEAADQRGVARPQDAACDLGASEGGYTTTTGLAISEYSSIKWDGTGSASVLGLGLLDDTQPVGLGTALTYTVLVTNTSGAPITGVTITETLPSSVALGAATASQGSCAPTPGRLVCGPVSLPSSAALSVTLVVTPSELGLLLNTIQVASDAMPAGAVNTTLVEPALVSLFAAQASAVLPAVSNGAVAWADTDNDGRLDALITGNTGSTQLSRLYHNNGDGTFTDAGVGLPGVDHSALAWGDYNNDGYLDLLLAGYDGSAAITRIYRNNGNGTFTDIAAGLAGVQQGAVAWGDYNGDGRVDALVTGLSGAGRVTKLYRNDGGDVFTDSGVVLPAVSDSSAAWGDYNNDGRPDLALTGDTGSGSIAAIYRNDGSGVFTNIIPPLFYSGISKGSTVWADYDNDGKLDLLVAGSDGSCGGGCGGLYLLRNMGGDVFTQSGLVPAFNNAQAAWGDYDNDGRPDVVVGSDFTGLAYHNEGGGVFSDALADLHVQSVAWGDANGDGRLDLLTTGYATQTTIQTKLFQNNMAAANNPPSAPSGLSAVVSGTTALLSWSAASDDHTPASGLSYNLRVGTTPGGADVLSPLAAANGTRRLPALGNAGESLTATLQSLAPGATYYWSVQAIDSAYAGSAFATQGTFAAGPTVQLSGNAFSVGESEGQVVLTATLSAGAAQTATVAVATSDGSALAGSDYLTTTGTLTFTPGSSTVTFTVPILSDLLDENNETFTVSLSSPVNAAMGAPLSATVTIVDDDLPPVVAFTTATQTVSESVGLVTATVSLNTPTGLTVTVPYTVGGTATGGGVDYNLSDGSFTIPPGELTATVAFSLTNDMLVEPSETVILTLGAPTNANLGANDVLTITIQDDDVNPPLPVVAFTTATQTVSESVGLVTATVSLDTPTGLTVTVPYTVGGTATGGGVDYNLSDGSFTIPPGELTATVAFSLTNDMLVEPSETVILTLGAPTNATLGFVKVLTITIQDDDVVVYWLYLPLLRR